MRETESYFIFISFHYYTLHRNHDRLEWILGPKCVRTLTTTPTWLLNTSEPIEKLGCSVVRDDPKFRIQQASENIFPSMISFRASPPSQELGAIGPGIAPQGDVSARSSSRAAGILQQHTLPGIDAFFAHCADPFRNSAETTDTSLDCRCSPDLSLHVDLLASSLRFWSPFPCSSAPGGCQRWLKGLPGGFKGPFNPSSRS